MRWFGTYWPSPAAWTLDRTAPPMTMPCFLCGEAILPDQSGFVFPSPFEDAAFETQAVESYSINTDRYRRARETTYVVHRACFCDLLLTSAHGFKAP